MTDVLTAVEAEPREVRAYVHPNATPETLATFQAAIRVPTAYEPRIIVDTRVPLTMAVVIFDGGDDVGERK